MGCDSLTIATDHKPLLRLLKDKTLDTVDNPRLFRLKQRVAMWSFDIIHCPGKSNFFADATSRSPTSQEDTFSEEADVLWCAAATISISLDNVVAASALDPPYRSMIRALTDGEAQPQSCGEYWRYRNKMYSRESVLLYDDRVVIPAHLRQHILDLLHSSHQGTTSMQHRAAASVFWPGISDDIQSVRDRCHTCIKIAPSTPQVPQPQSEPATMPFEKIAADYLDLCGMHYLVSVDRLSGWLDITKAAPGTPASGAKGLIACLRRLFCDKGVLVELSSDGGTEFTSQETQAFLRSWGVHHRLLSAHSAPSNGKAESAVKVANRLLHDHTATNGDLNTDAFVLAIMGHTETDNLRSASPGRVPLHQRHLEL